MKYYPIHKAMVPFLATGMTVINKKRWTVEKKLNSKTYLVTSGSTALQLGENDLRMMYLSKADIYKLRAFGSTKYIAKYADYCVTDPHADNLPTHAQLKALVDAKPYKTLEYLPINESFVSGLKVGMRVLMSGGTLCGTTRTITSTTSYCAKKKTLLPNKGIQTGSAFVYSQEWFARNVYVATADLEELIGGKDYVSKFSSHAVTGLDLVAGPTYEAIALLELSKKAHRFNTPNKPKDWLATAIDMGGDITHIHAKSEPGLKAKIALAFAQDPGLAFEVYTKVGEAKAQTLTQKILRFFDI